MRSTEYAVSLMPFSLLETDQLDYDPINGVVVYLRQQVGAIISGDHVVFSRGGHFNFQGGTNTVYILEVS